MFLVECERFYLQIFLNYWITPEFVFFKLTAIFFLFERKDFKSAFTAAAVRRFNLTFPIACYHSKMHRAVLFGTQM